MSADSKADSGIKLIATNPNGRGKFLIEDVLEAGIMLNGTEVKSLRQSSPNLKDAYVEIKAKGTNLEAWLLNTHIAPYTHGNIWNHEPMRRRKLLLHANEIQKLFGATSKKGMTVVPLKMYFKKGMVKVEIGVGKGKKKHDKRQDLKEKSANKEMKRALQRSR
jgi:SsrA-binding protein